MKREITKTVLVCDWCGSEENVRSYTFRRRYYDGHRNEEEDASIELCTACQRKAYAILQSADHSGGEKTA